MERGQARPSGDITSMQLYAGPERILTELRARGFADGAPIPVAVLNEVDQLHYHGTDALDAAIAACAMAEGEDVLEVGSGWGGCARYLAMAAGVRVTAVELQADYHTVGQGLTGRTEVRDRVRHVNADFLELEIGEASFAHAVSWLALFHIPRRADYLAKLNAGLRPGGRLFVEDLTLIHPPGPEEAEDFHRHLFPNSLVRAEDHVRSLEAAGFAVRQMHDMTGDWTAFTRDRLRTFRRNRAAYAQIHGQGAFETIEVFYAKMAGYFERGIVGGLRYLAERQT